MDTINACSAEPTIGFLTGLGLDDLKIQSTTYTDAPRGRGRPRRIEKQTGILVHLAGKRPVGALIEGDTVRSIIASFKKNPTFDFSVISKIASRHEIPYKQAYDIINKHF